MARRFEAYAVKRNDNLGDPDFWNKRLEDIDLRLAARELDGDKIAGAVDELTSVALARLNDTFTPVISEAIARLNSVGALFSSTSDSEATIGAGFKTFLLDPATRAGFVVPEYVAVRPEGYTDRGMIAQVLAYDRATGLLDISVLLFSGAGTYSDWNVRITGAPDVDHSTRTDNPHATTAAQVGAYSVAEVNALLAGLGITSISGLVAALAAKAPSASPAFTGSPTAPTATAGTATTQIANTQFVANAVAALVNSSPAALDTLKELADALGNDVAFSATVTNALGKRLRFDAAQTLTSGEKAQALSNIGAQSIATADGRYVGGVRLGALTSWSYVGDAGYYKIDPPGSGYLLTSFWQSSGSLLVAYPSGKQVQVFSQSTGTWVGISG